MNFIVEITDPFGNTIRPPSEVELAPDFFSWSAVGGPKEAEIVARGRREGLVSMLEWLAYRITIRDLYGQACWWGFVGEVLINLGEYAVGRTLEPMYNRISVAYTFQNTENELERGTTDWLEDGASAVRYGAKELLHSHADLEGETAANDLAQALLDRFSKPASYLRAGSREENTATLGCWGYWIRAGWRYFKELRGQEMHEGAFADQPLGVQWTGDNITFIEQDSVVFFQTGEHGFQPGNKVTISGSASNDGVRTIASAVPVERVVYSSNTMFFGESNDVYETVLGNFDDFEEGDYLQVGGSEHNSGVFQIDEMDLPDTQVDDGQGGFITADHIEFSVDHFVNEPAGPLITLIRNGYFKVTEDVQQESPSPGNNVTITQWGQKIAQRFQLSQDVGGWPLHEIKIRVRKVGDPQDGVKVSIQTGAGGSPSGSELASATLLHDAIGTDYEWCAFDMGGTQTLQFDTNYWIVIERTGAPDDEHFFEIGVDDGATYTPLGNEPAKGNYQLHTGTSWEAAPEERSLAFQAIGKQDTGEQIKNMILSAAPFTDVDTVITGVLHPMFREGDNLIVDEVEQLLKRGTSGGTRLLVNVAHNLSVRVYIQPAKSGEIYFLRGNGDILDAHGDILPPGTPMAGKWVQIEEAGLHDVPAEILTFFVEEATYDAVTKRWQLRPENAPSPFDFGLQQG